ncbi:MAG: peptide ABC transporter substrate-binding protein [Chloroflexi bacterium]|nr:peptide ABC transporter substrate-binding protein [Chloroflexota bacterium]
MRHRHIVPIVLLLTGLLTACQSVAPIPTLVDTIAPPTATLAPTPTVVTPVPTNTATPVPPKEFTICQAAEPNTLFIYGGPSRAAHNVLEAIYDGPVDSHSYQFQPVILEKLPNLADGDATLQTIDVEEGTKVVDIDGIPVELFPGVTVLNAAGQEVMFEGGMITMTQIAATFVLRTDITWADGQPLTANDSRYSFELANEFDNPTLRMLLDRTYSYDVADERTVTWIGLPGYHDPFYFQNFYHPLPRHVWAGSDAEQLLSAEVAHLKPLGWGPFVVEEWVEGEYIKLIRNSHYFRAAEGLPYLDRVIFRFIPDLGQALDMLVTGECDLISQDLIEDSDLTPLMEAADAGTVQLISSPSSEWEHLDFGVGPAEWVSYSNFFGDVQVRQAIAQCVDRERMAREVFPYSGSSVVHSYVPPNHPLYADGQLYHWDYDPPSGIDLLEQVGWLDEDADGVREAHGISGVTNRVPFSVTLLTTSDYAPREQTARILSENLADCGIQLTVKHLPGDDFFADGPNGLIFGRQFSLALFSWMNGLDAPCGLYLSTQIPGPENWWAASNSPGYASDDYDAACQSALDALPGMEAYANFHREAQRILSYDLPILPLYSVPKLVATRPEVSGVALDPGQYLELWNIEAFDLGY